MNRRRTPRTEFAQALKAIANERGLDSDVVLDTIKQAIVAAYRRDAKDRGEDTEETEYDVSLDSVTGEARIYAWPEGKEDEKEDVTPPGFGRIAAQTAKQVIHQKIREAEKSSIMDEYEERVGQLVSGTIMRFDGMDVRVDLGRTEGLMPSDERIPNEHLKANQRMTFLLKEITETPRGKKIILSRSDPEFVKKLFAREVPEISSGSVEIKGIAREAGVRSKVAVHSNQSGVDPVGSCVGQKGVRVKAITDELGDERVDIIPWSEDPVELIKASLSPAEGVTVDLNEEEETAIAKTTEEQLSLAIGKDGQNARLASALTGWRIEVEGVEPGKDRKKTKKDEDEGAEEDENVVAEEVSEEKAVEAPDGTKEKVEEEQSEDNKTEEAQKEKTEVKSENNAEDED